MPLIAPDQDANLRVTAMNWAMRTAKDGEEGGTILGRAMAYYAWVVAPLEPQAVEAHTAMMERGQAPLN